MFAIGSDEPLDSHPLVVRHSIVWLGASCGQSSLGIPASHPLCQVIIRLLGEFKFIGTWVVCLHTRDLREFKRKALLLQFSKSSWVVDDREQDVVRGHRLVQREAPWPYASGFALPSRALEVLVVGAAVDSSTIDCRGSAPSQATRGEELVLREGFVQLLVESRSHAICLGRTHTENSPGISIIGPPGLNPRAFVPAEDIFAVHGGEDAGRAWSYGHVVHAREE